MNTDGESPRAAQTFQPRIGGFEPPTSIVPHPNIYLCSSVCICVSKFLLAVSHQRPPPTAKLTEIPNAIAVIAPAPQEIFLVFPSMFA
jgi:hypothetical protein